MDEKANALEEAKRLKKYLEEIECYDLRPCLFKAGRAGRWRGACWYKNANQLDPNQERLYALIDDNYVIARLESTEIVSVGTNETWEVIGYFIGDMEIYGKWNPMGWFVTLKKVSISASGKRKKIIQIEELE